MANKLSASAAIQPLDYSVMHQINLSRYGGAVVREIIGLLNEADAEILDKISKRGEKGPFTTARLKALFVELGQMNYEAHVEAGKKMSREMRDFALQEAEATSEILQNQVYGHFNIVQPTEEQLFAIVDKAPVTVGPDRSLLLEEIFESLAAGKEEAIRGAIRLGMVEGETVPDMVRRLRGTRAARFTDGILEVSRRHAATMVRTIVNHTSNRAVQLTYAANSDVVKKWEFLSVLDSRTTITCASLNGREFPLGQGPIPPRHPNCRSFQLPVLATWRELGIDLDELPPAVRASKDGPVSADLSFTDWLRGQDYDVQKDILGATRAKLFREGGLPVTRFTDRAGVAYDLTELKERNTKAFERVFSGSPEPVKKAPSKKIAATSLKAAEDEIRALPYEKCRAFDLDGNLIFKKTGEKSQITFTREEAAKFKDAIFTHNHPSGSSFSLQDVITSRSTDMAEIRAVGTQYDHSLKRHEVTGWGRSDGPTAQSIYTKARSEIQAEYDKLHTQGTLTQAMIDDFHHAIIERYAEKAGLTYTRTKVTT